MGQQRKDPHLPARLLLVDDDTRLTNMVGDYLRAAGFEVSAAASLAPPPPCAAGGRFQSCWC